MDDTANWIEEQAAVEDAATKPVKPKRVRKPAKPKAKKLVTRKTKRMLKTVKAAAKKKARKPAVKKVKAKVDPGVRSERMDLRLTKVEKAKILAKAKKTRRTITSVVLELIEKMR